MLRNMGQPDENNMVYLDPKKTWVPLGVVFGIVGLVISWFGNGLMNSVDEMKDQISKMNDKIVRIETQLSIMEDRNTDRFSGRDAQITLERLGRQNPGLNIPDISDLLGDNR